jgi:hypothetical protein
VICHDWNINLLQENILQKALLSLLLLNNLLNTVACPTRVTTNSSSLTDVMIRNKIFHHSTTKVVELGYSDYFVQAMNIVVKCPSVYSGKTVRRIFSKRNIEIFNSQLKNKTWEDVHLQTDVNRAYSSFLTKYLKYFVNTLPPEKFSKNKGNKSG